MLPLNPYVAYAAGELLLVEVLQEWDGILAGRAEEVAHRGDVDFANFVQGLEDGVAHLIVCFGSVVEVIIYLHKLPCLDHCAQYVRFYLKLGWRWRGVRVGGVGLFEAGDLLLLGRRVSWLMGREAVGSGVFGYEAERYTE